MGLTAILSSDVLDIMSRDFYEKYEEYMSVMAERKNRQLSSGLKPYSTAVTVERHQLANFIEKAVQETAEWNKKMNQDRYVYRIISTKILKGLLIALPDCLECQTGDFGPGTLMSNK